MTDTILYIVYLILNVVFGGWIGWTFCALQSRIDTLEETVATNVQVRDRLIELAHHQNRINEALFEEVAKMRNHMIGLAMLINGQGGQS